MSEKSIDWPNIELSNNYSINQSPKSISQSINTHNYRQDVLRDLPGRPSLTLASAERPVPMSWPELSFECSHSNCCTRLKSRPAERAIPLSNQPTMNSHQQQQNLTHIAWIYAHICTQDFECTYICKSLWVHAYRNV